MFMKADNTASNLRRRVSRAENPTEKSVEEDQDRSTRDGVGGRGSWAPGGRRTSLARAFVAIAMLLGGAAALVTATNEGSPSAKVIGGNTPVNSGAPNLADISAHNSPTLVRNPVDGTNLAIANRIDLPLFSCALHLSFDGGANWAQTPLPVPAGEEPKCYAPDVAFGADGTMHLAFVTLLGTGNVPNAVWMSTSRDGGRTLSTPTKVLGPLSFQVRLVADPSVAGRLYLTWLQAKATATLAFPEDGYPVQFLLSEDGGSTWEPPVQVNSSERRRVVAPSLAVGGEGHLYTLYLDLGEDKLDYAGGHGGQGGEPYDGTWSLVVARSTDRGRTWTEEVVENRVVPTERFVVFLPPAPSLAVDRARGHVYVAFNDGRSGDSDVAVWSSSDGGRQWGDRIRVNDTTEPDRTSQYRPRISVAPNGRLDVIYYDRRSDADNVMNEVSLQSSFDEGRTFTRSLRLSDKPFSSRFGFGAERGLPDLGSRLGLVSTDKVALGVWSDTRLATEASNKQDLVMGLAQITGPRRLAGPVRVMLRVVGLTLVVGGFAVLVSWFNRRRQSQQR